MMMTLLLSIGLLYQCRLKRTHIQRGGKFHQSVLKEKLISSWNGMGKGEKSGAFGVTTYTVGYHLLVVK